jgi:hypothetical protein
VASAAPAPTVADTQSLKTDTASILGLQSQAQLDAANAAASDIQAAGYLQETAAYNTVGGIASNNAVVAGVAGDIKNLQQQRAVRQTIGSQRADIASAGFTNAGSSIDIFRDSVSQGALTHQLNMVQTTQTQGGYLEEGAAAQAEAAGATMASNAATTLAAQQRASGALNTANAANQTLALQDAIATQQAGLPLTQAQTLALAQVNAAPGTPTVFDPLNMPSVTLPVPTQTGTAATISGLPAGSTQTPAAAAAVNPMLTPTATISNGTISVSGIG